MLSYQHMYHAGNLADVQKHAILSLLLAALTLKERPISYMETHAGRGLYDLSCPEAQKTGESKVGVEALLAGGHIPQDHIYSQLLHKVREKYGSYAYPGSPLIARLLLRPQDALYLMELHPQEIIHLRRNIKGKKVSIFQEDGYKKVLALSPPPERRGLVLIDPSYEMKTEYQSVVEFVSTLHKKWPEAVIAVWYPMLSAGHHQGMAESIKALGLKDTVHQGIEFAKSGEVRGLYGSGMVIVNCPFAAREGIDVVPTIVLPGK